MRQEVEANETEIEGAIPSPSPSSEAGQSIILIVLVFVILLAFVGIAVDVGFAFARSSQFAAGVDAAALAGVQDMHLEPGDAGRLLAQDRAAQFLNVNGWPISETISISSSRGTTGIGVATAQGIPEFTLTVTWQVETFFLRLLNLDGVAITRSSSAAFFAQTDMTTSTALDRGSIRDSAQFIFGPDSCTSEGDPVSPEESTPGVPNPTYNVTGGTYHYRIRVDDDYPADTFTNIVRVELFDPDTYNTGSGSSMTVRHSDAFIAAGNLTETVKSCAGSGTGQMCVALTTENPLVPTYNPLWFARVDENFANCALDPNNSLGDMRTVFSLFYYDAAGNRVPLGEYISDNTNGSSTDLHWVNPSGFDVDISTIPLDEFGFHYIYLDVSAENGDDKNVWDLRAGPIYTPTLQPDTVNARNLAIANNPTITFTHGVDIYVMGRMPVQHFTSGPVMIPLAPVDAIQGGGVLYASIFDFQPSVSGPITFTMDTLSMQDFAVPASIVASNPDPELWQTTCTDGTTCDNRWFDPQWRIGIPSEDVAFFGGIVEATYANAAADAHTWYMAITAGRPILTR